MTIGTQTGLYYYRARIYSPRLGRFLQTDPVGTKDDLNLYAYTSNDPGNGSDPLGLEEYVVGLELESILVVGGRFGGAISYDTETMEIGLRGSGAAGTGLSVGAGLILERNPSSDGPARDTTTFESNVVASGNIGPIEISSSDPVNAEGTGVVDGSTTVDASLNVDVASPRIEPNLRPQIRLGMSMTTEHSITKRSAAIPRLVAEIKRGLAELKHEIACQVANEKGCGNK